MESLSKQPYEKFYITFDFSNVLQTSETLDNALSTVIAYDKNGTDVTSTIIEAGSQSTLGSQLIVRIQNGVENDSPYKITCRSVTETIENKWELDIQLNVAEV